MEHDHSARLYRCLHIQVMKTFIFRVRFGFISTNNNWTGTNYSAGLQNNTSDVKCTHMHDSALIYPSLPPSLPLFSLSLSLSQYATTVMQSSVLHRAGAYSKEHWYGTKTAAIVTHTRIMLRQSINQYINNMLVSLITNINQYLLTQMYLHDGLY